MRDKLLIIIISMILCGCASISKKHCFVCGNNSPSERTSDEKYKEILRQIEK